MTDKDKRSHKNAYKMPIKIKHLQSQTCKGHVMSIINQSKIVRLPYAVSLSTTLSPKDQLAALPLLQLLSVELATDNQVYDTAQQDTLAIQKFVDGRGLACPMPLLKTKVALRDIKQGESLYVVATDPNSQADITAFCRQSKQADASDTLALTLNTTTPPSNEFTDNNDSMRLSDTIYHFIITKTDSN